MPSRRDFFKLALAALHAEYSAAPAASADRTVDPLAPRAPHFAPRAKSVIFLFMDGGVSHVDSFDPKPRLKAERGQPLPLARPPLVRAVSTALYPSPFEFRRHGQSGAEVSSLFPEVAQCADELCIIRSMVADHSEHTAANYFMHSGSGLQGRPSLGAWLTYGLGSLSRELPGYVVLDTGMIPPGGLDIFGSGFLPASYQASLFRNGQQPVADIVPREPKPAVQRAKLDLLRDLDRGALARYGGVREMEAAVANYELAYRMQSAVPALADISGESEATRKMYGLDEKDTAEYGRSCLLARRLVERGVRFIELLSPKREGFDRWDQHANLERGHATNARASDKPIAALLRDLKARGLLQDTLVVWSGEFGRTPTAQGAGDAIGRDHHPYGFSMWLAGGGVKPGLTFGATDEYGYYAVENRVHVHDLHATLLHLLGFDHTRLTYPFSGRDMRLTDVHGKVVHDILS
ncbi:MAG TPA: DUF1501 domain-containing protein [Bryobacteraceae bacterium]|nr:DUF1501 domain-containing protein [Bryobacteraceae bacterium]